MTDTTTTGGATPDPTATGGTTPSTTPAAPSTTPAPTTGGTTPTTTTTPPPTPTPDPTTTTTTTTTTTPDPAAGGTTPTTTTPTTTTPTTTPTTVVTTDALTHSQALAGVESVLQISSTDPAGAHLVAELTDAAQASQGITDMLHAAIGTTSVATMTYEFFNHSAPTAAGLNYLVSATGPNADSLGSAYYQHFNLENRYINMAVNLGVGGDHAAEFASSYGALSFADAATQAYTTIFGAAPAAGKIDTILNAVVDQASGETRADYFHALGASDVGAKAAMVGWLLAEAAKADVGTYAHANDAYLTDVVQHDASMGVDVIGHYATSLMAFNG